MTIQFTAMIESFLLRDLHTLADEIRAYSEPRQIWHLPPGLPNSGGTLTLHLAGNLQHYVGNVLGGTGYIRDRAREFGARDMAAGELLREIGAAEDAIHQVLPRVSEEQLSERYREPIRDHTLETRELLLHLVAHTAYHLGQVSYHRRLVTGDREGVGALPSGALSTARPVDTAPAV